MYEKTVENLACRLKELIRSVAPFDIFNPDETRLLFRLLPFETYKVTHKIFKGGKSFNGSLTILLVLIWMDLISWTLL